MARLLGEARVAVLGIAAPKTQWEGEVKKATAGVTAKIPVELESTKFQAKLKELNAKIDELKARSATVNIKVDDKQAQAKFLAIKAKIEQLAHTVPYLKFGVDAARAEASIAKLNLELDKFSHKRVTATADVNTNKGRQALSSFVGFIGGKFAGDVEKATADAGGGSGKSFVQGFSGAFTQGHAIAAAVVLGFAALPAAIGAVGVLGGIALGAGIVFAADKLIKSQMKTLTAAIKAQTAILNSKTSTAAQKKAAADQLKQDEAQLAVLTRQSAAFTKLNNAVANLKSTFLSFAGVVSKPLIKPFTDAVNYLSQQLSGPLAKSFTTLFRAVGPLVKPVVDSLLSLVQGVLPGLTFMLNKARGPLSALFTGFGKIVGVKIGQWFKDATPYIAASSKYFLSLVSALGSVVSWLIKFGGATAIAFGGSQFKGFGGILKQIGDDLTKLLIPAFEGWSAVMAPVLKVLLLLVVPILNLLVACPPLTKALAGMAAAWILVSKAVTLSAVAMKLLGISSETILVLAPWIALAAAIVLAAILIVKYWKPISAFFVSIWKTIWSGAIGPMIDFFTNTIPHAFGVTVNWLKKNWPLIVSLLAAPMTLGMSLVVGVIVKYHAQIVKVISQAWGHIENVITGAIKPIVSVVVGGWNQVVGVTSKIWNSIALFFKKWWTTILTFATGGLFALVFAVVKNWNAISKQTAAIWGGIFNFFKATWGHIENVFTGALKPIVSIVNGAWTVISHSTAAAWNGIFNFFKATWGHIENAFTGALKPIASVTVGTWNAISHATAAIWNNIFNFFKAIWGRIENVFTGFLKPIGTQVAAAWNGIKKNTGTIFNGIASFFRSTWSGIYKNTMTVVNAISKGVGSAWDSISRTTQRLWKGIGSFMSAGINLGKRALANSINFVIQRILDPLISGYNTVNNIWSGADIKAIQPVHFAKGGQVPGYAPGQDTVRAMLSPGEFVINPVSAKALGKDTLHALNSTQPGGHMSTVRAGMQQKSFGGYVNPVGHISGLIPTRIDQGVDFIGSGPLLAIGNAVIGETNGGGWPGGPYMSYKLTSGPDAGDWVYYAENIRPTVHPGQAVKAGQTVANMFNGGTGIEIGWASAGGGSPLSQTPAAGGISGADLPGGGTVVGRDFENLIVGLGAPKANNYNQKPGGKNPFGKNHQVPGGSGGAGLSPAQVASFNKYIKLLDADIKTYSLIHTAGGTAAELAQRQLLAPPSPGGQYSVMGSNVASKIKPAVQALYNTAAAAASATPGNGPPGGSTGSERANGLEIYKYLLANLFGGNKIAAAGATAAIWGESLYNPFAQGTGGRGLIGWTPASTISNADFSGGMRTQLPAILRFVTSSGDSGVIAEMFRATSVLQAANEWGRGVERFGKNDVHSTGLALATSFMSMAKGGMVPGGQVFDQGGTLAPGPNLVYNLTGRPEHVRPTNPKYGNGGPTAVTLEVVGGGDSEFEAFMLMMMRKWVRTKGHGNVQQAFGKNR